MESSTPPSHTEQAAYRKVSWRLIPFLFLCYILAYLDRVNVGFAKLQMGAEPWFSDAVYATGAGIFFLGYFLFEVPSNVILHRIGARIWIARIMITWGLISSAMLFADSPTLFYTLRFLLGVAEAGFFPGIILYLTYWYPSERRARMIAGFMTAVALAGVVGGPVSGWILTHLDGAWAMKGWQWLFLLEGLPSVLVGLVCLRYLDDRPSQAQWLDAEERRLIERRLEEDERAKASAGKNGERLSDAFSSPSVWLFAAVYFGAVIGLYGVSFWLPTIFAQILEQDAWHVGLVYAIPWAVAAVGMVLVGRHSDISGERRWHVALPAMIAALALAASTLPGIGPVAAIFALTLATTGIMATLSCFWTLPTAILSGTAAAAGIAWINSLGNLAGYFGPELVNVVKTAHSMEAALLVLALCLLGAGTLVLAITRGPSPSPGLAEASEKAGP